MREQRPIAFAAGALAERVGAVCEGDAARTISGVAPLERAGTADLSFCRGGRFAKALLTTRAAAVLVGPDLAVPDGVVALRCRDPRRAFALAASLIVPLAWPEPHVHPTASVDPTARIGPDVAIEPFAIVGPGAQIGAGSWLQGHTYVGRGAVIGERCRLMPSAVVMGGCQLGDRVWLHPGAVVGADGFGHVPTDDLPVRVPQLGTAVIESDVEIGANACIDRAALDETRIGRGARLDNLVQVAHGVRIGAGCLLAAFAGVAGGARLGDKVVMAGRTAVVDGIEVGEGAVFAGLASASRDVPARAKIGGFAGAQLPPLVAGGRRAAAPAGADQGGRSPAAAARPDRGRRGMMDREEIEQLLPHRDPFLMVDRLVELDAGQRAVGTKAVRADQDWARGHFPGDPIFPGVLITEALAQVAALIFLADNRDRAGSAVYLVGLDKIRFRRPVRPGEELRLEVTVTGRKRRIWIFEGKATVDGQRVADGSFLATVQLEA